MKNLKYMAKFYYVLFISLPLWVNSQVLPYLAIKAGPNVSNQVTSLSQLPGQNLQPGYGFFIEPTIFTFGSKKQFDLNIDLAFLQKNSVNIERFYPSPFSGQPMVANGGGTYGLSLSYFSISQTLKYTFWRTLFIKGGPRVDCFLSYKTKSRLIVPSRQKSDFSPYTLGVTYAIGLRAGKRKQFIWELMGQNDFTQSGINYTTWQTYLNMSYMLNFGMILNLKNKNKDVTQ